MRKSISKQATSIVSKVVLSGLLVTTVVGSTTTLASAAESSSTNQVEVKASNFKDIRPGYWAAESIEWASEIGLIKGFPDGTFKPNDVLTEEQFTTMLTRFFKELQDEVDTSANNDAKRWADQKYEGLAHFKVPLLGYDDKDFRKNPVNRGLIAQVFAYLQADTSDLEEAVTYLFDKGVTKGSNPKGETLVEKFGATDSLTRAHAVAFFKRISESGNVTVHTEVIADKVVVDKDPVAAAAELEMAKKEAMLKVDAIAIPDHKELQVKKQELIKEKKEIAKKMGVEISELSKAIGEAKRAGEFEKVNELLLKKKELVQDKKQQNKDFGKEMADKGKAIGEAKRAGNEKEAQKLIDEKKQIGQQKADQNKEYGKEMADKGKAIGEAKRAGNEEEAQKLIDEKKQMGQQKSDQNREYGQQQSEAGKAIGEAKRAQYGKK
ncbi:S-layer homology domain-containing protein [Sporosarcina sp. Sa2YVA2]|uniref:S-layer homology domain-containing protein n=1 Tax=Sporosarcina quadrami TaxID=2762234 RepID=A0ABR8UCP0_9BACL|nr:S-layer homology domain-containing protein [Sporosarcina quadrami]MBD7985808.1 S-layer homology domain-containing protein [Sporosarcina quadrami]